MTPYLTRPDHSRSSSAMGFKDRVIISPTNTTPTKNSSVRETKSSHEKLSSSNSLPMKDVCFEDLRKAPKRHNSSKSKQFILWKKKKKSDKSHQFGQSDGGNSSTAPKESNLYDLYAICNHHGNMDSGHYIAYCCNPIDGRWYVFDDHHVVPVSDPDHLVTEHAYVLFYLRRGAKRRYSLLPGTGDQDHWIYKLIKNKMDLSRMIPAPQPPTVVKPQRPGPITTGPMLSTTSTGPSDNMNFISPPSRVDQTVPSSGHSYFPLPSPSNHSHFFSSSSSGGVPNSPQSVMTYPQSLPSPLGHTPIPNYFSQQPSQTDFGQNFTRTASFHVRSHNNTSSKKDGGRSATRL